MYAVEREILAEDLVLSAAPLFEYFDVHFCLLSADASWFLLRCLVWDRYWFRLQGKWGDA